MNTIISKINTENTQILDVMDFEMKNNLSFFKHKTKKKIYSDASVYSSTTTRELKFNISVKEWMDLKTVVLACKITNLGAGSLNKISDLTSMFNKLTIKVNNNVVEEINNYGRFCNLMNLYKTDEERKEQQNLNGGGNIIIGITPTSTTNVFLNGVGHASNTSKNIYLQLPSGFLQTSKLLPGMYLSNIEITLQLDNSDSAFLKPEDGNTALTVTNNFQLTDARIEMTTYEIDQILQMQFDNIIKKGDSIPISYIQYSQYSQAMVNATSSHLLSINSYNVHNVNVSFFKSRTGLNQQAVRSNNLFFGVGDNNLKISLNIAGVTIDEINSVSEAYYTSSKRVSEQKINVRSDEYQSSKFLVNFDLKKSAEGSNDGFEIHDYSGFELLNAGSVLISTHTDAADTDIPNEIYIVVSMVSIIEMRNIGITAWK